MQSSLRFYMNLSRRFEMVSASCGDKQVLTVIGEERILVAMDKEADEILLIQPLEALEDDLDLRMSLITS